MRRLLYMIVAAGLLAGCGVEKSTAGDKTQNSRGVAASCETGVHRPSRSEIVICGPLTASVAREFEALVDDQTARLTITSPGGSPDAALAIAEALEARGIELNVRKLCGSACAYILFVAAPKVEIEQDALVAFHHTSSFVDEIAAQWPGAARWIHARDVDLREKALYKRHGVSEKMLYLPGIAIRPVCVGAGENNGETVPFVITRAKSFIPKRSEVSLLRKGPWTGYWPENAETVGRLYQDLYPNRKAALVYGFPAGFERVDQAAIFKAVVECPADVLESQSR